MNRRVRALFFASLAVVLGPLALPERASSPDAAVAAPALETAGVRHEAHPAPYGARTWLPDRVVDRLDDSPLAPPQAVDSSPAPELATGALASRALGSTRPLCLLPPCRAPPDLS